MDKNEPPAIKTAPRCCPECGSAALIDTHIPKWGSTDSRCNACQWYGDWHRTLCPGNGWASPGKRQPRT
jgi:hypothetical protein